MFRSAINTITGTHSPHRQALMTGVAIASASLVAAAVVVGATSSSLGAVDTASSNSSVIPRANSAWVYDGKAAGVFANEIEEYNSNATTGHQLTQLYNYGSDLEKDQTFYQTKFTGPWDTAAYNAALNEGPELGSAGTPKSVPVSLSPIIDGNQDDYNLDSLSAANATSYADGVAGQVCLDDNASGIQFDYEKFDVSTTTSAQYAFYTEIGKDFAGGTPGCVDTAHPLGRYFSVFTFASAITPGTPEATNVAAILNTHNNGYMIDSLYDLGPNPAGQLNDPNTYKTLVAAEVKSEVASANALKINYAFGIPVAASDHEYTDCAGSGCSPDSNSGAAGGGDMLVYTQEAVGAIDANVAANDPYFVGSDIWDFGEQTSWGALNANFEPQVNVEPATAPVDVLKWLETNLPGAGTTGGSGPTSGPTPTPTVTPTPPAGTPGANLLTNSGFESGLSGWTCVGSFGASSTEPYAGTDALALTPSALTTSYCDQAVSGLTPNGAYTLSAELAGGATPITVTLDNGSTDLAASSGTGYGLVSKSVTASSSGTIDVRVQAYKQQVGTGFVDSVSLVAAS